MRAQRRAQAKLIGSVPDTSDERAVDGHFSKADIKRAPDVDLEPVDAEEPEE